MAWYVKRRRPDGNIASIFCEQRSEVVRNFYREEERGGEVWIEDVTCPQIEEKSSEAETRVWSEDTIPRSPPDNG